MIQARSLIAHPSGLSIPEGLELLGWVHHSANPTQERGSQERLINRKPEDAGKLRQRCSTWNKKNAREFPGVHVFHVERRSRQRRSGITT
ncbi:MULTISPECIES: hypothetical protein [Stenotrophomonas]|uniref:HNH endonuclease n=1 Tax=Stenotrophomonas lactitubi TaxID=2045214 RepID=A0AAW4GI91_9GAMM|nr:MULTISPECIES: hypothetical protein [Stenotrophomonas]MBM9913651.1 hypothetical protein [Stenotrophomonas lactitubi]MBM9921417.1 hypothetical protein [Stenotrophomonas lactitubi]MBM9938569.1 hypothetical protein [Stenotrophomonas lactitubi]